MRLEFLGSDNCVEVSNAGQADRDADSVGDACELKPTLSCVYGNGDGQFAFFGYENLGDERRFQRGALNATEGGAGLAPTYFPHGEREHVFAIEMSGASASWTLNGYEVVADASSSLCAEWPGDAPAPCAPDSSVVMATSASEQLVVAESHSCVLARDGADHIILPVGEHTVMAGEGNDHVITSSGSSAVYGGRGADHVTGGYGADLWASGGEGADHLSAANATSAVLYGGSGDDHLTGSAGADYLAPGSGVDSVQALAGDDEIVLFGACEASAGSLIDGGLGYDILYSPLSATELAAAGVQLYGIEEVIVTSSAESMSDCWLSGEPAAPPMWEAGTTYAVGEEVSYGGVRYVCTLGHTAIAGWEPNVVQALWALTH
ncbi:MAG: hypothetical protein MK135_08085 [Polyangiaceae bacterium]|nr:hypothetical protein [Polyangiaceae bacterium]